MLVREFGTPPGGIVVLSTLLLEEKFEITVEVCSAFCNLLREENESNLDRRRADIGFIKEHLTSSTDRRKRCYELVDLHKLKLQQTIQLLTCEKDEEQVGIIG